MGMLPLTFLPGESSETHGLTGTEKVTIMFDPENIKVNEEIDVKLDNGKFFRAIVNLRTEVEISYYQNGGVLPYVLRKALAH
jgi:aconitate hydratase